MRTGGAAGGPGDNELQCNRAVIGKGGRRVLACDTLVRRLAEDGDCACVVVDRAQSDVKRRRLARAERSGIFIQRSCEVAHAEDGIDGVR